MLFLCAVPVWPLVNQRGCCDALQVAEYSGTWSTLCLNTEPQRTGQLMFAVQITKIDASAGVAVGIALAGDVETRVDILGARPNTWAYSKTGNKGCGRFEPYGDPYSLGDIVTTEVDLTTRSVRSAFLPMDQLGAANICVLTSCLCPGYCCRCCRCCCCCFCCSVSCRFWKNGVDQGVAYADIPPGVSVVAAVCLGSAGGNSNVAVRLVTPHARSFLPSLCSAVAELEPDCLTVSRRPTDPAGPEAILGTCLLCHPGVLGEGIVAFGVRIVELADPASFAVGVVARGRGFHPVQHALGRDFNSWGVLGSGFVFGHGAASPQYMRPVRVGDVVSVLVNGGTGSLRVFLNGADCGEAVSGAFAGETVTPAVHVGLPGSATIAAAAAAGVPMTRVSLCRCALSGCVCAPSLVSFRV